MPQTAISIPIKCPYDILTGFIKNPVERMITSDVLVSDKSQTVSLEPYVTPRGLHFPELEVGPSDTTIPRGSVIAISASGNAIVGYRPKYVPVSGYLVDGLSPIVGGAKGLWSITSNNGDHIIAVKDQQVARFDGVSPDQVFPHWWSEGTLMVLNDDTKSVIGWHGDFIVIDSVPPSMR